MPSNALTVGGGAARGVSAFLQSFTQAKRYEHEEKLQKNAIIVELLSKQLEDPNTTYNDRTKILRSIPQLYGIKQEAIDPLMRMLEASNQEDVQTGERKVNNPVPQIGKTDEETNANIADITSKYGGQSTSTVPTLEKKGNLTPAKLHNILVLKQNEANDKQDIDKQTKLLTVQYELQKNILGKGGYTDKLPYTFDADKNLIMRFRRPADNDIQSVNLGKVTTEAIEKANIANDMPKGKLGQLTQARQIIESYEGDPTSYTSAQYKASKDLLDEFERNGNLTDAKIDSFKQNIFGTPAKPITPAQTIDDNRAQQQMQLTIQKDIDDANAEANAAKARMNTIENDVKLAAQTAMNADKAFAQTEFTISDPEYNKLRSDAEQARAAYNKIKDEYDTASRSEVLAKNKLAGAQNRLRGVNNNSNNPKLKAAIDQVRKNNPTQTANMTDDQIINYLRSKNLIQ